MFVKRRNTIPRLLFVTALLIGAGLLPARGAETANVDIHVSLAVSKSITINTTSYNFGSLTVQSSSITAVPVVVTNDSNGLMETYTLQATNAISDSGGQDWTLAASTGTDQFNLQGQFSSSRPSDNDASWSQDSLSLTAAACSADVFGNGNASESGEDVQPSENRNLWFRIKTPSAVTDAGSHTVTVTLSVF